MSYMPTGLKFFHTLNTEEVKHLEGNLSKHLIGTFELLKAWHFPEYVALAGLFHSILGTSKFSERVLKLHQQIALSNAIGESAYLLVRTFSIMQRPKTWKMVILHRKVSLIHGGEIFLSIDDVISLISIEYANLVEQKMSSILTDELRNIDLTFPIPESLIHAVENSWGKYVRSGI